MAKPLQYCKVISLQLNKFIFKKKTKKDQILEIRKLENFLKVCCYSK